MEYVGQFFIKQKRTSSNQTGKMLPRRLPGSGLVYIKAKYLKFMADPPFADGLDIHRVSLPVNSRYSLLVYADASFAVGVLKQSLTGYVVFLNGSPLLWGSLKQTIAVLYPLWHVSDLDSVFRVGCVRAQYP